MTTIVGFVVNASVAVTIGSTSRVNLNPSGNGWPDSVMVIVGAAVSMKKLNGPTVVEKLATFVTTTWTVCVPSPVTGVPCMYALLSTVIAVVVGVGSCTSTVNWTAVLYVLS